MGKVLLTLIACCICGASHPPEYMTSAKENIAVLCYHQVRDWKSSDTKNDRTYIIPPARFSEQMKMLHDSGYHTILPGDLVDHINSNKPLPSKPILLTFDDGSLSQYEHALPELDKYGFKAAFFIMTVTIGRKEYMDKAQIKKLSEKGYVVGCHTWDHHSVNGYHNEDWNTQLVKPKLELQQLTGKQVEYFAYPNGIWTEDAVKHLDAYGYKAAFQLWSKADNSHPVYTIKRILVDGRWEAGVLYKIIQKESK